MRILIVLLCCLYASPGMAQSSDRNTLQYRLTEQMGDRLFTQTFDFVGNDRPSRFICKQLRKDGHYDVYDVHFDDISAMDIVQTDRAVALLLTFRHPMKVNIMEGDGLVGSVVDATERQTLAFARWSYREAVSIRLLFESVGLRPNRGTYRHADDKRYPEMVPLPEGNGRRFSIGKYPVKVREYRAYCSDLKQPMPPAPPWGWHSDHPIAGITWEEANAYVDWLSEKTGEHYRLPTKEQWQYAAYDNRKNKGLSIDDFAWFGEIAEGVTQPVGQKLPTGTGIYDMRGNVWEWLDESLGEQQAEAAGGSCDSHFEQCQWNSTASFIKSKREFDVGFRVVKMEQDEQP